MTNLMQIEWAMIDGREYRVAGIGRVGTYAAAKAAHRCRNRRHWVIQRFDHSCSDRCRRDPQDRCRLHYPIGYVTQERLGHWKTKRQAGLALGMLVAGNTLIPPAGDEKSG